MNLNSFNALLTVKLIRCSKEWPNIEGGLYDFSGCFRQPPQWKFLTTQLIHILCTVTVSLTFYYYGAYCVYCKYHTIFYCAYSHSLQVLTRWTQGIYRRCILYGFTCIQKFTTSHIHIIRVRAHCPLYSPYVYNYTYAIGLLFVCIYKPVKIKDCCSSSRRFMVSYILLRLTYIISNKADTRIWYNIV